MWNQPRNTVSVSAVLAAALALWWAPAFSQTELVTNGTFEAGFVPDGQCDLVEPDGDQLPVAWSCFETWSSGVQEPSLITAFPMNGPSLPGMNAAKLFRSDQCNLSGDWTTIEQALNADVSSCQSLALKLDVILLPLVPGASHNLGGSGHVAGPCHPSGYEYPISVKIDYVDAAGMPRCWQYGWYQFPTTQAGRTDPGCFSGFDGQNANPNPSVSQLIPMNQWVAAAFDLRSVLTNPATLSRIRVGGSGWSFDSAVDNIQILCENPCGSSHAPECSGACPTGQTCTPSPAGDVCLCEPACELSPYPDCHGICPPIDPSLVCAPDPATLTCRCQPPPCEQTYPMCNGPCPAGLQCAMGPLNTCVCEPPPCEQSFPTCNGPCPAGERCVPDATGTCRCEPLPCEQGPYPVCNGPCPVGLICVSDDVTESCRCQPPPCEQTYPMCNGPCPAGQQCAMGALNTCVCEPVRCEQSFPQCGGPCPTGQQCVASATGTACECQPLPCEQSPYPQCGGPCPPHQQCVPDVIGGCRCVLPDDTYYKVDWPDYAPSGMPDFEQLHRFPLTNNNPRTICGPTALLNSLWWFDSEMECDTHHTSGDAAETEPNDVCAQADVLGETPQVPGRLAAGTDQDWYVLTVPKGGPHACTAILSTFALAVPGDADTRLTLFNTCPPTAAGQLGQNDDSPWGGPQSDLTVQLGAGTYYLRVDVGASGLPGPYTLTLGLDCYPLIERWIQYAPDDHSEHNVEQSIASLAVCANTDDPPLGRWKGTRLHDMETCIDTWLLAKRLSDSLTERTAMTPTFEEVESEVKRSEDVVLLLGFYWQLAGDVWMRCGGHYVTVAGIDSTNRTVTVSDPFFNNAEPLPAGNGGPGRVRGPDHTDHAPGINPPPDHDNARNVSHDRYIAGPPLAPHAQWSILGYASSAAGATTTCEAVQTWCSGSSYGQNPKDTGPQEPCPAPNVPVTVAVEAMVDVSPVQSTVCVYLDGDASWPDNLRMHKGACDLPAILPDSYDVIRGKHCGLALGVAIGVVSLGNVQCLYNDRAVDRYQDAAPDDDVCFGSWFYLIKKSTDLDYGDASNANRRYPSSGGCP